MRPSVVRYEMLDGELKLGLVQQKSGQSQLREAKKLPGLRQSQET